MDIHGKIKDDLIRELSELRQENDTLKELFNQGNSIINFPDVSMLETTMKLSLAIQGAKMAWWEMDVRTGNVAFDKQKVEMLGYQPEQFKHYKDFTDLVHPKDYQGIMQAMQGHLDGILDKYEAEYRIMTKSGEYIWFYDYGSIVKRGADGTPLICTGFVSDISERKKAEQNLLKITKALDFTTDAIAISDSPGRYFYQNKAFTDIFGSETSQQIESTVVGVDRIKDTPSAKKEFNSILKGISWSGELDLATKDGRFFSAHKHVDTIEDNEGNVIGVIRIITDITERKRADETLRKSEHMLLTVLENFPGVVFWKDKESNYLGCNKAFAIGAGLSHPSEIVGKTDFDLPWSVTEANDYRIDDLKVMESGEERLHIIEKQHQTNNQVAWFDTSKFALRDSEGQIIGVIGVSNDITLLKIAEQDLIAANKELTFQNREKEKRSDELMIAYKELSYQNEEKEKRAAELSIANIELAFQNKEKEKRAEELLIANKELHYQNEEKGKRATELSAANHELAFQNREKEKRADEVMIANKELHYQNEEKEKRAAELSIANIELAFQNKEKEKRAEELIIANKELNFQNEEKGKRAAELSVANQELAFQNREKEKRADELMIANKELRYQNEEKVKRAEELKIANRELSYQNEEKEKRAEELILANKELKYQNEEKEKRAAELVIARDKAQTSDRLKTAFLNNISHEIRTPLNGILGFASLIVQPDNTAEDNDELLGFLNSSTQRLIDTINDYMDISLINSNNMEAHLQLVDIGILLGNVFESFREACAQKKLKFNMQLPANENVYNLNTDRNILIKAISKLLDNSVKYTNEGTITLGFEINANEIQIFVKDDGIGIEPDVQDRIFDSFMQGNVTNNRDYEGSGLGLSIAKGMVELLGGKIRLESKKDHGTQVFLPLPGAGRMSMLNQTSYSMR